MTRRLVVLTFGVLLLVAAFGATAFAADAYPPVQTAAPSAAQAQQARRAPLAVTGSDATNSYLAVGAILVVIGAVLVVATVRRRRAPVGA